MGKPIFKRKVYVKYIIILCYSKKAAHLKDSILLSILVGLTEVPVYCWLLRFP